MEERQPPTSMRVAIKTTVITMKCTESDLLTASWKRRTVRSPSSPQTVLCSRPADGDTLSLLVTHAVFLVTKVQPWINIVSTDNKTLLLSSKHVSVILVFCVQLCLEDNWKKTPLIAKPALCFYRALKQSIRFCKNSQPSTLTPSERNNAWPTMVGDWFVDSLIYRMAAMLHEREKGSKKKGQKKSQKWWGSFHVVGSNIMKAN